MKKTCILLLCAVLLSACSMTMEQIFLIPTNTYTPTVTSTSTLTEIPTLTATIAMPTFTNTPTLAGQKTQTSTPDFTPTSLPTVTPIPNTPTPTVEMGAFVAAFTSKSEFFKAGICEPTTVKFTAQVGNAPGTAFVVLFVRFKSKQTGTTSEWTSITMDVLNPGTFVHDLVASEMKGVDYFNNSWVQYQFVATDSKINELGRTAIFSERLSILDCVPTPTQLVSPTVESPTTSPSP